MSEGLNYPYIRGELAPIFGGQLTPVKNKEIYKKIVVNK